MDFPFTWCHFWSLTSLLPVPVWSSLQSQLSEWRLKLLQQSSHGLPVASLGCIRQQSGRLGQDLTFAAKLFEVRQVRKRRKNTRFGACFGVLPMFLMAKNLKRFLTGLLGNLPSSKNWEVKLLYHFEGETKNRVTGTDSLLLRHVSCIHICCIVWHFPSS